MIGQKIGRHQEKNGGRHQEKNGGRHQEKNGRSKWRSTPGEKRRLHFPPKFPPQFPPNFPPNLRNFRTNFRKFPLTLNLVIDQYQCTNTKCKPIKQNRRLTNLGLVATPVRGFTGTIQSKPNISSLPTLAHAHRRGVLFLT